jgi:hypothetical protein
MRKNSIGTVSPFSAQILKFIDAMVMVRDEGKAAVEAGAEPEQGHIWMRRLPVKEEVERRMKSVEHEVDKAIAKKRIVTVEALDKNLMQVVKLSRADVKESPTLATSKVKAIELGYQRTGILIDGNFIPDAGSDSSAKGNSAPRIFRASEQSIITHQITETHQTVTTRAVAATVPAPRPVPPPTTIEAEQEDPWAKF